MKMPNGDTCAWIGPYGMSQYIFNEYEKKQREKNRHDLGNSENGYNISTSTEGATININIYL